MYFQPMTTTKCTCTRCGGSGKYAFNAKDGTVCYGCRGTGFQMVDLAARAKKQAAAAVRADEANRNASAVKEVTAAVKAELNSKFGPFDIMTEMGVELLNRAAVKVLGKTIWEIRDERMAA